MRATSVSARIPRLFSALLFVSLLAGGSVLVSPVAGQAPGPTVRILEPAEGSFQTDQIVIRAAMEPATVRVERMEFFGDGRLICRDDKPPFECVWNAGAELRAHTVRVVAILPGGDRIPAQITTKDPAVNYSVDVPLVRVTVVVKDDTGFVRYLPRSAFRVYEDDVQQPIVYFGAVNESSLELVTAVDISDSMTHYIEQVKVLVKKFLSGLREKDHVRVFAFNENPFLFPDTDLAGRLAMVDDLAPWGMTALYDTIIRCFDLLGKEPTRLGIVVFTDGKDTASHTTRDAVERRADASDAVMYMIGQGQAMYVAELKALCERLATRSGGRAFFPRIEDLGETFNQILEDLSNQYLLTYEPPTDDAKWHRIRVEVDGGRYQVRHKQGRQREEAAGR